MYSCTFMVGTIYVHSVVHCTEVEIIVVFCGSGKWQVSSENVNTHVKWCVTISVIVVDIFNGRNDLCDCGGQFNNGRNDLYVQTNSEANYPGFMSRNDLKNNI